MDEAADKSLVVGLGFDAAWGYAPADQTSPALAGAAGALTDTTMTDVQVTELRIHGVSGSNGPTMLEHPQALQVAGDGVAGFFRRWSPDGPGQPSVPWKLEAYSWGGLTEAPLASASWLLLAPFMMYNVAYFMLPRTVAGGEPMVIQGPEPHLRRDRGHQIAHALLRLLAMAATIQFVTAAATVTMSTVAWQAAGPTHLLLPNWMGWYGEWTAGWRVALALAFTGLILAGLWWISVRTATKYEARTSVARPELNAAWPLTQPGFWRNRALVGRQRELHVAAAAASVALIAVLPAGHAAAARWVAIGLAGAVLAAAVFSILMPLADRHTITMVHGGKPDAGNPRGGGPLGRRADTLCRGVLIAALVTLVISALVTGWTNQQPDRQPGALPGLPGFLAVLLIVQAVLLIVLAITVMVLARRARQGSAGTRPYLGGNLATLVAALGFSLGGLLTAVINFGVTRLLGTAEPSGFHFAPPPSDALAVPWPVFAFGIAPVGLLIGAVLAGIVLFRRYRRNTREFGTGTVGASSPVAAAYAVATAGGGNGDDPAYRKNRGAIARAWARGLIVDHADVATALAVSGALLLVLAAEIAAAIGAGAAGHPKTLPSVWHGAAALVSLIVIAVAGGLVTLLRQAYTDPAKRKTIGALWDVGTFWPRAVHPLAPPCYAERAVPEVVDRIRLLTGHISGEPTDIARLKYEAELPNLDRTTGLTVPSGPLLLTGYSQGSVIAPAVVAQLPACVLPEVALLTLACPAQRLYGRAFPAYFGQRQLTELASLLDATAPGQQPQNPRPGRWKNLRRRSDYIGSFIFAEPEPRLDEEYLRDHIDQPCLDPPVLVPDANPSPPPIHRHSQFWPDPRTTEVAAYLVNLLIEQPYPDSELAAKPTPSGIAATGEGRAPSRSEPSPRAAPTVTDPEPVPSQANFVVNAFLAVGRWRRGRAYHESVEFANAGPPPVLSTRQIGQCVPAESPPGSPMPAEGTGYHIAGQPEELTQAWLWTLALDAEVRAKIEPRIKSTRAFTYGFVQGESTVRLAVIFYVRISALAQAAPLFVEVGSQKFPLVIRPPFKDIDEHANVSFTNGQIACAARLGRRYGVLTAAHVVGRGDKYAVAQHDKVTCSRTTESDACEHEVLAIDPNMDAALVEAEIQAGDLEVVRATDIPGFFRISIDSPFGRVESVITEVGVAGGVIPGTPGQRAPDPALLFSIETGYPGWSGSLVSENLTGQPYCMFLGTRQFHFGKLGRLQMLRQIEIIWGAEMLQRRTK